MVRQFAEKQTTVNITGCEVAVHRRIAVTPRGCDVCRVRPTEQQVTKRRGMAVVYSGDQIEIMMLPNFLLGKD